MPTAIKQWIRKDPLQANIFFVVILLHLSLFFYLCIDSWLHPIPLQTKNDRLVVKTIELGPAKPTASKTTTTHSSAVVVEPAKPPKPTAAEPKAKKETVKPKEKEPTPVVEKKAQETQKKIKEDKKVEPKKKEEPKVKPKVEKKSAAPATPVKEKAAAATSTTTKIDKAKQQEAKRTEELLKQAQESISKISKTPKSVAGASSVVTPLGLKSVGKLQADATPVAGNTDQEVGYIDELVGRLKLLLKLPEFGDVKTQLTISRGGRVTKVVIVHSESAANRTYIEKTLPTLTFPAFGSNFGSETQHTFQVTLRNDL